jgi:outer membrane receptor protein involved in Fe transport
MNFFKVTRYGDFNYSIKATQFSEFLTPADHDAGAHGEQSIMVNRVGKFNYDAHTHSLPKMRLNTFLSWTINDWVMGMNTRYVEGYSNERQIPASAIALGYTNYVKSFLVHDFSVKKSYQFSLGQMEIGLGIINAFDKKAPLLYDAPDFSFDTKVHDPRGQLINLTAEFNL